MRRAVVLAAFMVLLTTVLATACGGPAPHQAAPEPAATYVTRPSPGSTPQTFLCTESRCIQVTPRPPAVAPVASPSPTATPVLYVTCLNPSPGADSALCRVVLCQASRCVLVTPPPGGGS